ncbi:cytochrome P450 [Streptomyces fungicidicus]|uniref:cytochrome P450 n=1 Tax=Streptomyces fungicidicus TaxID=68203 RepID=UPI00223BE998|nr:cytochrome P450 [Streptomyces fungicidicus]
MPLFVENAPGEGNAQARSSLLYDNMANDDPPKHTALRKPVNGTFTSRAVATKRAGVRALAEETLDAVADQESFGHVKDFAFPSPSR